MHREQHAAMDWFQTITHIRQGTTHDHTHGVIEVRLAHLFFKADWQGFFSELLFHVRPKLIG